jgi:hypothetical protein
MSGRLNADHECYGAIWHGLSSTDAVDRLDMQYLEDTATYSVLLVAGVSVSTSDAAYA